MKNVADRSLVIGAILVGAIIAVAMWFLAISPKLASAQTAREATVAQNVAIAELEETLALRKAEDLLVPDYTRELYAMRDSLPPTEDIPAVRRTISELVSSHGLVLDLDNVGETTVVPGGISLAPQMEAVGLTSNIEGMVFTTLYATPFTFEVVGPPEALIAIIEELQEGDKRYFDITALSFTQAEEDSPGWLRASITVHFFTFDYGVPDITVRPPERPWPGTEEIEVPQDPDNPYQSITQETYGSV